MLHSGTLFIQESPYRICNKSSVFFQSGEAGIQKVKLKVLEVAFKRMSHFDWEDLVVFSPDNERWRLMLAKIDLPFHVMRHIVLVIVEERLLD